MKKKILCISLVTLIILMFCGISSAAEKATIKRVQTNQSGYLDYWIEIKGELAVSNYYNYGYKGAQKTHFSFKLTDNTGTAYVYLKKEYGYVLRNKILRKNKPIKGKFTIRILKNRYKPRSRKLFADLESW